MATQAVLKYLKDTNRPYSANDIVQNMHKEYTKGQIQKSLDELVADGSIFEKVYGKQKVYCIKQEDMVVDTDDQFNELNSKAVEFDDLTSSIISNLECSSITMKGIFTTLSKNRKLFDKGPLNKIEENLANIIGIINTRKSAIHSESLHYF